MIPFKEFILEEPSPGKKFQDQVGKVKAKKVFNHPWYKEHFASNPEPTNFEHEKSPAGAYEKTMVHNSLNRVHFIHIGNKISNAHHFVKSKKGHWQHIKSERPEE